MRGADGVKAIHDSVGEEKLFGIQARLRFSHFQAVASRSWVGSKVKEALWYQVFQPFRNLERFNLVSPGPSLLKCTQVQSS